jgi:hypothetical protein
MKKIIELINSEHIHFRDENIIVDENDKEIIKDKISLPLRSFDVQNIEKSGLILDITLQNMFYGEIKTKIYNIVLKHIFNSNNIKKIDGSLSYKSDSELYKLLNNNNDYTLVSNVQVGTVISDMSIYNYINIKNITTNGHMYEYGNIYDNAICIDPYMRWDDNRMAMVFNKFFNFKIDSLVDLKYIDTFTPALDADIYIKFNDVIVDLYQVENIQI